MKILKNDRIIYRIATTNEESETKSQAIATHLKVPLRNAQTSLDELMNKGMLSRVSKVSVEGRRCYYYALTPEGKKHAELLQIIQQFGLKNGKQYI